MLSVAAPIAAQPAGDAALASVAAVDPDCPPEHAAMGHCTPRTAAPTAPAPPAVDPDCPPEHAAMGHCTPRTGVPSGAAAPPVAPPPPAAFTGPEHAADTVYDKALMSRKRASRLIDEHGGYRGAMVLLDRSELRIVDGRDGYAWDWKGWYGGDYNRLWIKTEGEGDFGGTLETAEVQALFSRAIGPWWNLQTGIRHEARRRPGRTQLVAGVQGLAPYWFEVDAAAFLSTKGELTARIEAEYDQRLTNWLILQPRVEIDLSAQDIPERGTGAGLSMIEAGLRLRYEIRREFAPYVGVQYESAIGRTARFAQEAGEDAGGWTLLIGLRSWF